MTSVSALTARGSQVAVRNGAADNSSLEIGILEIRLLISFRGPDGALATPSCVSAGVGPSCLALGSPLRQWPPAVPDVSDDVSGPPSWQRRPRMPAVLLL